MNGQGDLEGQFIAANHQRTGRAVANTLLASTGLPDAASVSVRRTHTAVLRSGSSLIVAVGGGSSEVTATTGSELALDMLAHSRGELLRGVRKMHRGAGNALTL